MRRPAVGRWAADARLLRGHLGLVARVHLAKLLLVVPPAVGVGHFVHHQLGRSLEAERFAAALEPALLIELARRVEPGLSSLAWALLAAAPLAGLGLVFLDGVLLGALLEGDHAKARGRRFFALGARSFGPLLRLVPAGLLVILLFGGLPAYGLHRLGRWLADELRDERLVLLLRVSLALAGALLFLHARTCHRVARLGALEAGGPAPYLSSLIALGRRPATTLGRVLPWTLALLAVLALGSLLDAHLGRTSWPWVILGLGLQQATGLARTVLGAGALAAEWSLRRATDHE